MASRNLAARLHQGMRAQRAITGVKNRNPGLTRSLATPVSHGSTTESTTLSNGFTVCIPLYWVGMGEKVEMGLRAELGLRAEPGLRAGAAQGGPLNTPAFN